ncbi:MAG: shikimate dehydrogenase [Anaerolineae bacterium]|nr:shikimate dehydrogenase [Anaerolineae bacterium]
MDNFALMIHPLDARRDVARRYPLLAQLLPQVLIRALARRWPPLLLSHVQGVRSQETGEGAEGWLLACPLTAGQMLQLPPQAVYDKIVQTGRLAQRQGARLLGLSAFTSLVGDGGVTIAQRLNMPVTNGNTLTVGLAVEALRRAAEERGLALDGATAAVVGGSGSVGLASAEMLAPMVEKLILVGRQEIRLSQARAETEAAGTAEVRVSKDIEEVLEADVVLSATSAPEPVLYPPHLKKGAIVCDVALPPDVAPEVREQRADVSVINGVVVDVPGPVDFGFDFGLPPGRAYPSMAEAMVLALEGRYESYSLGQRVYGEKVREMMQLAHKHGFRLSAEAPSPARQDG